MSELQDVPTEKVELHDFWKVPTGTLITYFNRLYRTPEGNVDTKRSKEWHELVEIELNARFFQIDEKRKRDMNDAERLIAKDRES